MENLMTQKNRNHHGISQSAISLYRFCPYAYHLKYNERCEPMFWDRSAMDTGNYGHISFDKYYKFHFDPEENRVYILSNTYAELSKVWDRSLGIEEFKKAYTCLEHHADWEYRNINNGLKTKPLTEVKLCHEGYYGIVDYLHLDNFKPVDFKTGRHASLRYEYLMQAYVYKVLIEGEFRKPVTHFYFFFLYPNEWRCVKFDTDKMKEIKKDVEGFKKGIEDNIFPKKPRLSTGCKNCDYKYYCKILEV